MQHAAIVKINCADARQFVVRYNLFCMHEASRKLVNFYAGRGKFFIMRAGYDVYRLLSGTPGVIIRTSTPREAAFISADFNFESIIR